MARRITLKPGVELLVPLTYSAKRNQRRARYGADKDAARRKGIAPGRLAGASSLEITLPSTGSWTLSATVRVGKERG